MTVVMAGSSAVSRRAECRKRAFDLALGTLAFTLSFPSCRSSPSLSRPNWDDRSSCASRDRDEAAFRSSSSSSGQCPYPK